MAIAAAIAAGSASVAQADPAHLTAESTSENVKLKWEADPELPEQKIFVKPGEINCDLFAATGTIPKTNDLAIASNVSYKSTYFESGLCDAFAFEAEVRFNGCSYSMNVGTFIEAGRAEGTMDLVCPPGKSVQILLFFCTFTLPAQSGLGPVTYTSGEGAPGDITVDIEAKEISYSVSGSFICKPGSYTDGIYNGQLTLKAYEDTVSEPQIPLSFTST
jgi:hypothetical protein